MKILSHSGPAFWRFTGSCLLLLGACGLAGCALQSVAPPVTPGMVATQRGASTGILEEGRRIFTGTCTACHSADPVDRYSMAEWHRIVGEMADRSKLSADRQAALLAYLQAAKSVLVTQPKR